MGKAKQLIVRPITAAKARAIVRRYHYSGKVVQNSQLHFGVYYEGRLEGAMQLGPSLCKANVIGLVDGTGWNDFIELNRMAFSERLPRNSESRALAYALRTIRKNYPHIKWVVSFSDACQSGDGTIYRATGFLLTGIKRNVGTRRNPQTGEIKQRLKAFWDHHIKDFDKNWEPLDGFMIRYIYFLDPAYRDRLVLPPYEYSVLDEWNARMARGQKLPAREAGDGPDQGHSGGATPTRALHDCGVTGNDRDNERQR